MVLFVKKPTKIKKSEASDILIKTFENDELFEILALSMRSDEDVQRFMATFGCSEKYALLAQDKVFLARKKYMQMLGYIMQARNAEKLWINNGHSPNDLMRILPRSDKMTIVPGSSNAANLLKECQDLLPSGLNFDFDSNAVNVPIATFPSGIAHDAEKVGIKKVYPNDPCPCGSNKKFKKCCGRK